MNFLEINKARELSERIRGLEKKIESLRVSRNNIVPVLDGMPHASEVKSKVEKLALRIVEGERELDDLRTQFENEKTRIAFEIMAAIDEPLEQATLLLRYVSCLSFRDIARRLRCNLRQVFKIYYATSKKFSQ